MNLNIQDEQSHNDKLIGIILYEKLTVTCSIKTITKLNTVTTINKKGSDD